MCEGARGVMAERERFLRTCGSGKKVRRVRGRIDFAKRKRELFSKVIYGGAGCGCGKDFGVHHRFEMVSDGERVTQLMLRIIVRDGFKYKGGVLFGN